MKTVRSSTHIKQILIEYLIKTEIWSTFLERKNDKIDIHVTNMARPFTLKD